MFKRSLQAKLLVIVTLVTLFATLIVVLVVARNTQKQIFDRAKDQVDSREGAALRLFQVTDQLMNERVQGSIKFLMQRAQSLGDASLGDEVAVGDRRVANLYFGGVSQANNFELVDGVTSITGGTATIFARSGNDFVRISTNVMKEGRRVVGTVLDPEGKAIKAIRNGEPFYGQVDILGNPFLTAYVPIKNRAGETIGILYVGYKADLAPLEEAISESKILSKGMLIIVDDRGRVRMHSRVADLPTAEAIASGETKGWVTDTKAFEPWNYRLIAAYPEHEVDTAIRNGIILVIILGLGLCAALIIALSWLTTHLIITPLKEAMFLADKISQGQLDNVIDRTRTDEIGGLNNSLSVMQEELHKFVDEILSASAKLSNTAHGLSSATEQTSSGVIDQHRRNEQVATAMEEMTASISESL